MVEKCSDSTTVSVGSTLPLPTGDRDVATGETIEEESDKVGDFKNEMMRKMMKMKITKFILANSKNGCKEKH